MADRKPVWVRRIGSGWWLFDCAACGYKSLSRWQRYAFDAADRHARHCEAIALQYLDFHDDYGSWCTKGNCAWQSAIPDDQHAHLVHYERSHTL